MSYIGVNKAWLKEHDQQVAQRVLDAAIALIGERIMGITETYEGETNASITARPYAMTDGMQESVLILKSLRDTSKQERP